MQSPVAGLMDDVTDPSDWKHDFTILKNLDASLRCDLCFDIYASPVSIKSCHHTFCSTCIRTHINQSGNSGSFCPKCRQTKAYDSELIPQPVLEVTALEWIKARSFLARLQREHDGRRQQRPTPQSRVAESSRSAQPSSVKRPQSAHDADNDPVGYSANPSPRRSKRVRTEVLKPAGSRSSPLTVDDDEDDFIVATDDELDLDLAADGSTRKKGARDADDGDRDYVQGATSSRASPSQQRIQETEDSPARRSDRDLRADDLVECPICSHRFTVTALNRHLDRANCYPGFPEPSAEERGIVSKPAKATSSWFTKGSSSTSAPADGAGTMVNEKRLVRPQYNLRSDRELRKLLDDAGLPTNGDRERLIERHRQWINIWNANLDSSKARHSAAQLRKDLAAWERVRYSAKDHSAHVDKQKTTWVKSNKSQFDDLIAKARMGAAKDKNLRGAPNPSASDDTTPSSATSNGLQGTSEAGVHVIHSSPADSQVRAEKINTASAG